MNDLARLSTWIFILAHQSREPWCAWSSWCPSTHFQLTLIESEATRARMSWRRSKDFWLKLKGQLPWHCFRADSPSWARVMPPASISKNWTKIATIARAPHAPASSLLYADWSSVVSGTQLTASHRSEEGFSLYIFKTNVEAESWYW